MHTTLTQDELLDHLSSASSIRPKADALLYRSSSEFGGPHTPWARTMRRAQADARGDPRQREHRAWLEQHAPPSCEVRAVHATYAERLRRIEACETVTKRAEAG